MSSHKQNPGCQSNPVQVDSFTLADFEYDLPPELIAQEPAVVRHQSRLLVVNRQAGSVKHNHFQDLPDILQAGDLLVVNDTKVIPARIDARRATGGIVEILLLKPEASKSGLWQAMGTPIRRLKPGEELFIDLGDNRTFTVIVKEIIEAIDGQKRLLLDFGSGDQVFKILSAQGSAPLPPYIHRQHDDSHRLSDLNRYQTVFAQAPGAVAAPTAGLHFSDEVLSKLSAANIDVCSITLHVGPGTFKPITTSIEEHSIESERFAVPLETANKVNQALAQKRRVIAVGTTACRALETAGASGQLQSVAAGETSLYIRPGFDFKIISGLITNFHLSKSSLLVLVSSFASRDLIMHAYREAIKERYRFFSYGDAMLIL
jgi:S-adenosylmethionine:tRNA ribosyltransferase-isomerase